MASKLDELQGDIADECDVVKTELQRLTQLSIPEARSLVKQLILLNSARSAICPPPGKMSGYFCSECGATCQFIATLDAHMKAAHGNARRTVTEPSYYRCNKCKAEIGSKDGAQKHADLAHHGDAAFTVVDS